MSRLLIVEDSRAQAKHLQLLLSEPFDVAVALDGFQALKLLECSSFDLILTDIVMPGLSGYDVCRRVKSNPLWQHLPVILMTSLSDPMAIVEGIECGADHFIPKPYQPDRLIESIRTVLTNRAPRASSTIKVGVEAVFLGKKITITSGKEQILDLLLSTCQELVHTNQDLQARRAELQIAKDQLEVRARTTEIRAEEVKARLAAIVESSADAIISETFDGIIDSWNAGAERLFGYTAEEVLGKPVSLLAPSDRADEVADILVRVLCGERTNHFETIRVRKDGTPVNVSLSVSPVTDSHEKIVGAAKIVRDITEQKSLELQLRQAQKMEAVGQLAGGVAHDFNNLLTVISGYSELLLSTLPTGSSIRNSITAIREAGERAAGLTRQLLAFSRQNVMEPSVLDLNDIVKESERILGRLIGEDISLTTVLEPNVSRVKVDPGLIGQVVMNLAVNARDAMPTGGKITIETGNVELSADYARFRCEVQPGNYVMLAMSDTGHGMTKEVKAHIFEPFFTTKGVGKGTGLGLSMVHGIVKQSGGHIEAYSEVGVGTTFKIYLPAVDEQSPVTRESEAEGSLRVRGSETVLLVEDEKGVRGLALLALQTHGYTVLEAKDGLEALQLIDQHKGTINMVVTDVVMPNMSGRELTDTLRVRFPQMKVLFVSGYTDDTVVRHGLLQAEVAFLQKPYTPSTLAKKVREVLDQRSEGGTS